MDCEYNDFIKSDMKYVDYISARNFIMNSSNNITMKKVKVAILRSFTIEPIEPIILVEGYKENILIDLHIGGYNQYYIDIFNENSELYNFKPDIIIMSVRLDEIYPSLISNFIKEIHNLLSIEEYIINQFRQIILKIKQNLKCNLIINNFVIPINNSVSFYDFQNLNGQVNFIRKLNYKLVELANEYNGVYISDVENMCSIFGKKCLEDKKSWIIAKNPYNHKFYIELSKQYVKLFKAIYGIRKKCVVIDLDNTIWGGIIGEDGVEGISLGESYPGKYFKDFQNELLKLKNRGVVLAVCSKNNYEDVIAVLDNHPDMLLQKSDFANIKVNWEDKAANIKQIAEELNIGLDSIVFIDDSRFECELIKHELPEVQVVSLPQNPSSYVDTIHNLSAFETVSITDEDLNKTQVYMAQQKRNSLRKNSGDLEKYYFSLQMTIEVNLADKYVIPRISQLTQKTNQFNLTTRRYTEEDIEKLIKDDDCIIYYVRVRDKFGDSGISGCCILNKLNNEDILIDTFLLSCRVMGRNIERAFLSFIAEKIKEKGFKKIVGEYVPNKKNKVVEKFYESMGFKEVVSNSYSLELITKVINCPDYIKTVGR